MKTFKVSLLAMALGLMSFSVQPNSKFSIEKRSVGGSISWKSDAIELGEIPQGTPKTLEFEFQNTGSTTIVITKAQAACGCTVADYSKEPIEPGKTGIIKATYNATAAGSFTKTITVTTTADESVKVLTFKGKVVPKS